MRWLVTIDAVSSINLSTISIHNLTGKLAPRSDARPIEYQHPRHNSEQSAHASQKAASALESHRFEHLWREQRERASQNVTTETLRSERGAGVAVVCVGKVVEDSEIDAENAHCCAADAESRKNPVVGWERSPAEPEAAHR